MFDLFKRQRLRNDLDDAIMLNQKLWKDCLETEKRIAGLKIANADLLEDNKYLKLTTEQLVEQVDDLEEMLSDEGNQYQQRLTVLGDDIAKKDYRIKEQGKQIDRIHEWIGVFAKSIAPRINQLVEGWSATDGRFPWEEEE